MRRLALLALLGSVAYLPVYAQQTGWVQTWSDEFNGTTLDPAIWNVESSDTDSYGGDQQYWRPENVVVANGRLQLVTKRESFNGFQYTSGAVTTQNKLNIAPNFLLEVSAKLPKGQGIWPAIWTREGLMPDPNNGIELDLMESLGRDPRTIYVGAHRWVGESGPSTVFCGYTGVDYSGGQHIYSVEVLNGVIRFYVDRALRCGPTSNSAPILPSHILLNTSVGGSWGGPTNSSVAMPQTFEIDYVRLYKRGPVPPAEICGNGVDEDGDAQVDDGCDTDGDGVPVPTDACPTVAASTPNGCPPPPDTDGDGVPDPSDACPTVAAATANGCPPPPDTDGDGVPDPSDACPTVAAATPNGCPPPPDADGDGVPDASDACPTVAAATPNGCPPPPDTDGDGVPDASDACPTVAATTANGCPPPPDTDGDGVPDASDACPTVAAATANGCPPPAPSAPAPTFTNVVTCSLTLTATPPTTQSGWTAQFQRDGVNVGTSDSTAPFSKVVSVSSGPASYRARWTRSGSSTVNGAAVTITCP